MGLSLWRGAIGVIEPASDLGSCGMWARDRAWRCRIKIEKPYFDGCPTYLRAQKVLRKVLAREDAGDEFELVAVGSDEEAQRLLFPGIPTIRTDGKDLFPVPERTEHALGCRMYAMPEDLKGSPTAGMLEEALIKKGANDAELHL